MASKCQWLITQSLCLSYAPFQVIMITQTSEIAAISNTADCGPREKKALVTGVQLWSLNELNQIIPSKCIFQVLLCGSTKSGYGGETGSIWGSSNSTYRSKQKFFVFPSGGLGWGWTQWYSTCPTVSRLLVQALGLQNKWRSESEGLAALFQSHSRFRRKISTLYSLPFTIWSKLYKTVKIKWCLRAVQRQFSPLRLLKREWERECAILGTPDSHRNTSLYVS